MLRSFLGVSLAPLVLLAVACSVEPRPDIQPAADPPAASSVSSASPVPVAAPTSTAGSAIASVTKPPVRPGCVMLATTINPKKDERIEIEGLLTERAYADPSLGHRTIMLLRPREPVCVLNERGGVEAEGVKEFQVFESEAADPGLARSLARLTSQTVVLGGGVIPRFTAHHATDFLWAAMDVRVAPKRSSATPARPHPP
jgi:hypothetical protein